MQRRQASLDMSRQLQTANIQSSASGSVDTISNSPKTVAFFKQQVQAQIDKVNQKPFISDSVEDDTRDHDVLRFIPDGPTARLAFHELAQMKVDSLEPGQKQELDGHHAQFIYIKGKASLMDGEGYDSGSGVTSTGDEEEDTIYQGYYRLGLDTLPSTLGAKWVLGKGVSPRQKAIAHSVDILLAAPESKYRRRISAAHAFLRMHPLSGAWILRAGITCNKKGCTSADPSSYSPLGEDSTGIVGCDHEPVLLDGTPLRHGECRALIRPRTTLVVGGLRFSIQFSINTTVKEKFYLKLRADFMQTSNLLPLSDAISGIPFEADVVTPFAVFRRGLGSGSFGSVFDGFHPTNGNPRAVKRLQVMNEHAREQIEREIQTNMRFSGNVGVVKCFGWCNASSEQSLEGRMPFDIFIFQEKGISFVDHVWETESIDWELRSQLFRQLLLGLVAIHGADCIHRDITPMNILYFPDEPKHAALCDFGKLHDEPTDTNTALAAWRWLPPEIVYHKDARKRRRYNQKIDIWMLALTLAQSWFQVELPNQQLDHKALDKVIAELDDSSSQLPPSANDMGDLLMRMLEWKPEDRLTAEEALQAPFLRSLATAEQAQKIVPSTDRKRLRDRSLELAIEQEHQIIHYEG